MPTPAEVILYFFIYSFLGWVWETLYCSVKLEHFVYRGFLKGPYCPIYGFGVLLVLYLVIPLKQTTLELFIFSAIAATILEYAAGYMLDRVFKVTLWHYDHMPMNINGRVAVPVSVFWGFCCVLVVRFVQPQAASLANWLYTRFGLWLPGLIVAIMLVDLVISSSRMFSFRSVMAKAAASLNHSMERLHHTAADSGISPESPQEKTHLDTAKKFPKLRRFDRHLLRTFPNIDIREIKNFKELKKKITKKE